MSNYVRISLFFSYYRIPLSHVHLQQISLSHVCLYHIYLTTASKLSKSLVHARVAPNVAITKSNLLQEPPTLLIEHTPNALRKRYQFKQKILDQPIALKPLFGHKDSCN